MKLTRLGVCAASSALLVACGGAAVPQERLTSVERAISAAEAGGAPAVPKAQLHLKQANDQLASAKALIADGEEERADWVLQRAEVDAELALTLAREDTAKKEAQEAVEQVEELRKQLAEPAP
jgi:chromosome segregation ATPase